MRKIVRVLAVASAPFLLESALEMYVLTPLNGPQNLFLSVAHLWPMGMLLVGASGLATMVLLIVLIRPTIAGVVRSARREEPWDVGRILVTVGLSAHLVLLATYAKWAQ